MHEDIHNVQKMQSVLRSRVWLVRTDKVWQPRSLAGF
jgi:hypothetical protein